MTKIRTTITIDKELLDIAHHHKIRISTFLHNSLREYLSQINGSRSLQKTTVGPLRFELKSIAPEATRIPSYPTGPQFT
jgi:hypothetical protein